ncbi:MAG: ArnT family glycosyltransferase [Candidatus Hodarchaeota archaeon]
MQYKSRTKRILSYEFLVLSLIIVLGFALRFYHLPFYLSSSSADSVGYSYSALIYSRGEWVSRDATPKGFLSVLLMALFYNILGPTLLAGQLVSFLFGGLLPVITFFVGSELFDKKAGLLGAFVVSINPLLILYSCLVFREMVFSFTWMCSIYFALRGFKGNVFYSILGGIFFALSSMTIEIGIFGGIGFILYFLIQKTFKNKGRMGECKNLDVFLCSAFLTLVPLFVKDYIAWGDPFFSWTLEELYAGPIRAYISLIGLSVPYTVLSRVFFRHTRLPSIDRYSNIIKASLVGFAIIALVLVVSYFSGLFSGTLALLAAETFTGFVKFVEYLAFPEALGLFLILFSLVGIVYGLKSRDTYTLTFFVLIVFLFSYAVRAAVLSENFRYWGGYSLYELLTWGGILKRVFWPFHVIFRYFTPFIPLFSIFAGYGILFFSNKISGKVNGNPNNGLAIEKNAYSRKKQKKRINKNQIFKMGLISVMSLVILFQYFYAGTDLFARADSHDSYQNPTRPANVEDWRWMSEGGEGTSIIDWLHSQGSPVIYSFNSLFKKQYGEDKVILLGGNENLLDIAVKARQDGVEFIVSDAYGVYSDAQYALFRAGLQKSEPRFAGQPVGYYELVRSYLHWHMAQIFRISLPERTALVIQGDEGTGAPWVQLLSSQSFSYMVQIVDDEERLTDYLTIDYDLIVLAEIRHNLENDELSILREKVETGTILIMNGVSPAYMNLEENNYWLGAQNFVEAPRDAKWNITFTEDALNVLTEINLDKNYALYSQNLYSSPTGCTGIEADVVVYAERVDDGAIAIFAKPYYNGVVIFSGVRHLHASKANDYGLYINFIENLLEKASNKTLIPPT